MAFKSTPGKGMSRSKPLQTRTPIKQGAIKQSPLKQRAGFSTKPPSPADQRKMQQQALQKATLRALEKAKREAAENGVNLTEWENEFIDSVSERVRTYGRAFADPDKGAMNGTLSLRQGVKLKEIRKKKPKPDQKKSSDDGSDK